MNTSVKILAGFLLGTTVGIATGLLVAPASGNKTRKKLMKRSRAYSQQAIDAVRYYLESLKKGYVQKTDAYAKYQKETVDNLKEIV